MQGLYSFLQGDLADIELVCWNCSLAAHSAVEVELKRTPFRALVAPQALQGPAVTSKNYDAVYDAPGAPFSRSLPLLCGKCA